MNRDDIIRMAREAGALIAPFISLNDITFSPATIQEFAALVAAAEREACAKVCEELLTMVSTGDEHMDGVWDCINAIRARGQE